MLSQDGWDDLWPHGLPLCHHPPPLAAAAHDGQEGEGQQAAGGAGLHFTDNNLFFSHVFSLTDLCRT